MHLTPRSKFILTIVVVAVIFVGIIVAAVVGSILAQQADQTKKNTVYIAGIENCSANLNNDVLNSIRTEAFSMVAYANNYNKVSSLTNYQATIRAGSCTTSNVSGDNNVTAGVKNTSVIVDIPKAKQSWKLTYSWVANGTSTNNVDLGSVTPSCVSASQLIYGDFNCDKILNQLLYGTDIVDPILQYVPYSGQGLSISYDSNTKQVTAQIQVLDGQEDNQTLINNIKGQVVYWFEHNNLNITSYNVVYQTVVVPVSVD